MLPPTVAAAAEAAQVRRDAGLLRRHAGSTLAVVSDVRVRRRHEGVFPETNTATVCYVARGLGYRICDSILHAQNASGSYIEWWFDKAELMQPGPRSRYLIHVPWSVVSVRIGGVCVCVCVCVMVAYCCAALGVPGQGRVFHCHRAAPSPSALSLAPLCRIKWNSCGRSRSISVVRRLSTD